tara:strand:+ start:436 stop:1098 length:663 start_codon:yes stop_codon:yes gene_type:complete
MIQSLLEAERVYVGGTTDVMSNRLSNHLYYNSNCRKLREAILDDGRRHFRVRILASNVPEAELEDVEAEYIAMYDAVETGYNILESGNISHPGSTKARKAAANRPDVKAKGKKRMTDMWKPGGSLRLNFATSYAKACKKAETKAKKKAAGLEVASRPEIKIQRGLTKRATTVRKRAEKRAKMKTEKERLAFDKQCRKSDNQMVRTGASLTLRREREAAAY